MPMFLESFLTAAVPVKLVNLFEAAAYSFYVKPQLFFALTVVFYPSKGQYLKEIALRDVFLNSEDDHKACSHRLIYNRHSCTVMKVLNSRHPFDMMLRPAGCTISQR